MVGSDEVLYGSFASANIGESFVLEIVGIVIVFLIVRRYIAPLLAKLMNQRAESIRVQLAAGDEARAAAQELVAERHRALEQAREEAVGIVEQARHSAEQLVAEGHRKSQGEYGRIVARATVEIELERNRVRDEVMREMSLLVVTGARRLVDEELDEPRHHLLIDEAIVAAESETSI